MRSTGPSPTSILNMGLEAFALALVELTGWFFCTVKSSSTATLSSLSLHSSVAAAAAAACAASDCGARRRRLGPGARDASSAEAEAGAASSRRVGAPTEVPHHLLDIERAPLTATLEALWQQSPEFTGGQFLPRVIPHFLQPSKKLPVLQMSLGGGLGGGGKGGGGRGGGEYCTHVTHDVICAPLAVLLVALSQHRGDVEDGLSGFPWPKPWLAHLQPATMLSLEHTSWGGGRGGGGRGGGGRGGGEYSTHVTNDVICAPVTVIFVALSQHSGDVDEGLSGSPCPKPWLAHLQPATMFCFEHTSLGGGLGGGGNRGGGRGGGEYSTHQAELLIWEPSTVTFVFASQHSPVASRGLSGSPLPPPALPHPQPTNTSSTVHGTAGPGSPGAAAGAGAGVTAVTSASYVVALPGAAAGS